MELQFWKALRTKYQRGIKKYQKLKKVPNIQKSTKKSKIKKSTLNVQNNEIKKLQEAITPDLILLRNLICNGL